MSGEKFKIIAGMLALQRFTGAELAEASGVNPHTVNSWLRRKARDGKFICEESRQAIKKGRPRIVWKVREEHLEMLRDEIAILSAMPHTQREASTQEEAAAAFEDNEIRDGIRYHLKRAAKAEDASERERELKKASLWYRHEKERLLDWINMGFNCPDDIREDMIELRQVLQGLSVNVDKLGLDHKFRRAEGFAK
ncbi:hypothetical protein [Anderseniella sp. Alg231-50]|uniref:hypothetical protein n=1 Tax=Anderseniella sp. Alg231-50 TaxID=1922226 RepID=UPI000D54B8BF